MVISLIVGAASHIIWDGFTHDNGYFVQVFSELSNIININGHQIPIYKILQHSSTLLGGLLILFAIHKLPTEKTNNTKIDLKYWGLLLTLTFLIILLRFLSGLDIEQYGNVVVTSITAILLALTITPLVLNQKRN